MGLVSNIHDSQSFLLVVLCWDHPVRSLGFDLPGLGTLTSEAEQQTVCGLLHQMSITNHEKVSEMIPVETCAL